MWLNYIYFSFIIFSFVFTSSQTLLSKIWHLSIPFYSCVTYNENTPFMIDDWATHLQQRKLKDNDELSDNHIHNNHLYMYNIASKTREINWVFQRIQLREYVSIHWRNVAVLNKLIVKVQYDTENNVRNCTLSLVNTHLRITIVEAWAFLRSEILAVALVEGTTRARENVANDKSYESSTLVRRYRLPTRNNECLSLATSAAKKVTTIFHR